jgi:hypothetical protein
MSNIITAGNATNNGTSISSDTSGVLELKTGSTPTTAIAVDASQNVGIGTSSPSANLEVKGASGQNIYVSYTSGSQLRLKSDSGDSGVGTTGATPLLFLINNAEKMRIDSSGNVGIGTTTIGQKLVIENNSSQLRLRNTTTRYRSDYTVDSSGNMEINSYDDTASAYKQIKLNGSPLVFAVGSEAMRINSSGNVLMGTTSLIGGDSGRLSIDTGGGLALLANRTGDGNIVRWYREGSNVGNINVTAGGTAYNTSSDYRLKNSIAPMTGALEKVALLKPCTYKWNADGSDGQGFIAHELAEVVPNCVTGEKDAVETYTDEEGNEATRPAYQGIDTSFLVATLTAAIQELKAELDATKAEVAALKGA